MVAGPQKKRSRLLISNRQFVPLGDPRYYMKRTANKRNVRTRDTNRAVGGKLEAHNHSEHKKLIISYSSKKNQPKTIFSPIIRTNLHLSEKGILQES
jgi:hypothetical protein